jgi:hypothetical protein
MIWAHFMGRKKGGQGMWLSDICKYKCSNAKAPPWRFLMKISPFTAVEFRLCNIPKLNIEYGDIMIGFFSILQIFPGKFW